MPPVPGLAAALAAGAALTSDTVWQLEALPGRLAVLGGGSIGCELGQAFARLGSQVTVAEAAAMRFDAAVEITTSQPRVELMFPADADSADALQALTSRHP